MESELIQAEQRLEDHHRWFIGRRTILDRALSYFVGRSALAVDVGCGSGRNLEIPARHSGRVFGLDSSPTAVKLAAGRGFTVLRADGDAIPLATSSAHLMAALDILEHMDDDMATLTEFHRVLRPGGHLLLAVPANRFLWSEHDEALRHRRRYIASELHIKLNHSVFEVLKRSYVVFFPFSAILGYRLFRGIFPKNPLAPKASHVRVPSLLNRFFVSLLALEARLLRSVNLPFGSSIVVVARKTARGTGS
jgi:SAM-dependent methyltransferase